VFDALSDSRTYPEWFHLPHIQVQVDGPPEAGTRTRARFKGKLPLTFEVTSRIVRINPPQDFELEVEGDLGGRAVWTLTPQNGKVLVRFDWRSYPQRRLLRYLTPVLLPLFRWNHHMAMRQAKRNLEPYVRQRAGLPLK